MLVNLFFNNNGILYCIIGYMKFDRSLWFSFFQVYLKLNCIKYKVHINFTYEIKFFIWKGQLPGSSKTIRSYALFIGNCPKWLFLLQQSCFNRSWQINHNVKPIKMQSLWLFFYWSLKKDTSLSSNQVSIDFSTLPNKFMKGTLFDSFGFLLRKLSTCM